MRSLFAVAALLAAIACKSSEERKADLREAGDRCGYRYGIESNEFFDCLRNRGVDPKDCNEDDCKRYARLAGLKAQVDRANGTYVH